MQTSYLNRSITDKFKTFNYNSIKAALLTKQF